MTKQELDALLNEIRDLPVDDFAVAGRVASITARISEEFDRLRGAAEPSVFQRPSPETIEWGKQVVAEMKAEPTRESGSIPATFVGLGEVDIPIANLRCPTCGGGYYRNAQGNLQHDCPQNRGGK
jgi:hypothetical protein